MSNESLTSEEKEEKLKNYFDLIEERKMKNNSILKQSDL